MTRISTSGTVVQRQAAIKHQETWTANWPVYVAIVYTHRRFSLL